MSRPFPDLIRLFDSLQAPASDAGMGRFCAFPIPGFPSCAVGKDVGGNPVLLIRAEADSPRSETPVVLEHLSVIHLVNCRVQDSNALEQERVLSVVRCTDADRILQEYFLRSLFPIAASLPERPTRQQIGIAINRLVDLFRQLALSPRKTVAGLWAELFVVAYASNPERLLEAWHTIPEEHFDFFSPTDRIEVKSVCGSIRTHHFSLEQLRPPTGTRVIVASILLSAAGAGTSLYDLIDVIRQKVAKPELLIQLDSAVAQAIGQDWRAIREIRFDLQAAIDSLRFFDANELPSVSVPIPNEVSAVHFRVDLSGNQATAPEALLQNSELFRAAVPASTR